MAVYPTKTVTDFRGQSADVPDMDNPVEVRGWVIPDRSSRAEVPGQQEINVIRIGVPFPLPEGIPPVDLWSRVEWDGQQWDVAAPPDRRFGTRQVRHQTIALRRRTIRED